MVQGHTNMITGGRSVLITTCISVSVTRMTLCTEVIYIYIYILTKVVTSILHEAKYDCDPEAARLGNKTIFCPKIMFGIILRDEKNHTPRLL